MTFFKLAKPQAKLLTFEREPEPLKKVLDVAGLPEECGMATDSRKLEDVKRIFSAVDERLGGIDVLIACAALDAQPPHEMSDEDWRYIIETNLVGYLAWARGALKRMIAQGSGLIVLVSSISPEIMAAGESVCAATKGGINHFVLTLRKEVGDKGVRIT